MRSSLFAAALALTASLPAQAYVDLHAHPFMDDGMGPVFHGRFEDDHLVAKDWHSTFDSQINEDSLERSELQLLVVSLYAHPVLNPPRRAYLRKQYQRLQAFLASHPGWRLVRSAEEALAARREHKRLIVLALEGASGVLESEEDLHEWVDVNGVRIVTFLHLTDDHLGGAAFFSSMKGLLFQPFSWLRQMFSPRRDEETGARLNKNGLTEDGVSLARRLMARGVWLDLAHSSDESQRKLIPLMKEAGQPVLYTHTALRRFGHEERALADWQLEEVRVTGGIIGLMPSEHVLDGTPSSCADGLHRLAEQHRLVASVIGETSTVIGSDFNGGIEHLGPTVCPTGTELDGSGLWNIGQSGALFRAVARAQGREPVPAEDYVSAFIRAWGRVSAHPGGIAAAGR